MREVRLSLSGAVVRVAEAARAARRRSICRGAPFVSYLENHDQVANCAFGKRLHQLSSPGSYRALTALTLLGPATPMLFQGQEFASSAPFLFFADHREDLREADRARAAASSCRSSRAPRTRDVQAALPPPGDRSDVRALQARSRRSASATREAYALHRDLLALRREDPAIAAASTVASRARCSSPVDLRAALCGLAAATIACWSSTWASSSILRRCRSRCSRRRSAAEWIVAVEQRGGRYGGQRHAVSVRMPTTAVLASRAKRRVLLRAGRQPGERRRTDVDGRLI